MCKVPGLVSVFAQFRNFANSRERAPREPPATRGGVSTAWCKEMGPTGDGLAGFRSQGRKAKNGAGAHGSPIGGSKRDNSPERATPAEAERRGRSVASAPSRETWISHDIADRSDRSSRRRRAAGPKGVM